jgi:outer membrane protein
MKHHARLAPLLPALALLLASNSASAFDLSEAWQAARSYNSDYAASRADLGAGREQAVQGRAQLLPQVALTGSYSHTNPTQPAGQASYDSSGYGVQLAQPLFDVSKYSAYQKGKIASQQADISFSAAEQQLMVDIARAYFDVLLAEDTLAATRASKRRTRPSCSKQRPPSSWARPPSSTPTKPRPALTPPAPRKSWPKASRKSARTICDG